MRLRRRLRLEDLEVVELEDALGRRVPVIRFPAWAPPSEVRRLRRLIAALAHDAPLGGPT